MTIKLFNSIWMMMVVLVSSIHLLASRSLAFSPTTTVSAFVSPFRMTPPLPIRLLSPPSFLNTRITITTSIPTTTTLMRMETSNRPQHHSSAETVNAYDDDDENKDSTSMIQPMAMMNVEQVTDTSASSSTILATPSTSTTTALQQLGPTELLLLQRHHLHQQGLRQEYGCTIKNDSYDYIRSLIWLLFKISNIIFPTLGILLTFGLGLNLFCGLGYVYDPKSHTIIIDTLEHLRFQNQFINSL